MYFTNECRNGSGYSLPKPLQNSTPLQINFKRNVKTVSRRLEKIYDMKCFKVFEGATGNM